MKLANTFSANSTISTTVETDEIVVHDIRVVRVVEVDFVGLDGERASGDARGNGWVDEAMSDDAEVCVDEGVVEHTVGDEDSLLVYDFVNICNKIFDKKKKNA